MNILVLTTFPVDEPMHGGQHRVYNICRLLRDAGHSVESIGVQGSDAYPPSRGFVGFPGVDELARFISNPFLMEDWAIGELFTSDEGFYQSLAEKIECVPDLIYIEHPWLFQFAKRWRERTARADVKLVYGSANIEHELKYGIVKSYLGRAAAESARERVLECEIAALKDADIAVCVSENDARFCAKHTSAPVLLAPNGVRDSPATLDGISESNRITAHHKFALYCASGHPPNITGFFDMFGEGVGCLSPVERLVVAGGAGQSIRSDPRFAKVPGLARVYVDAGLVSDQCLQGLLRTAHTVLLPVTFGGGTNLKTAEALWSGRHVVATRTAMRGFEQFQTASGVEVQADSRDFRAAVRRSMASLPLRLTAAEQDLRRPVLWEETLKTLIQYISTIEAFAHE